MLLARPLKFYNSLKVLLHERIITSQYCKFEKSWPESFRWILKTILGPNNLRKYFTSKVEFTNAILGEKFHETKTLLTYKFLVQDRFAMQEICLPAVRWKFHDRFFLNVELSGLKFYGRKVLLYSIFLVFDSLLEQWVCLQWFVDKIVS